MPRTAREILEMSDEQLMEYTLSGEQSSLGLGQAALIMRAASRMEKVTRRTARITIWLVCATFGLVVATGLLAYFTAIYK